MSEFAETAAPPKRRVLRTALAVLARHSWIGPTAALLVLYAFFCLHPDSADTFRSWDTARTMLRQTTWVALAAVGMTLIIILGGIDLSVGSVIALTSVVTAWVLQHSYGSGDEPALYVHDFPVLWPLLAAGVGVMVAALCGLLNAALITALRITPFIVTLGAMSVYRGAAKGLAGSQKIDAEPSWINDLTAALHGEYRNFRTGEVFPSNEWLIFPPAVWLTLAVAVAIALMLHFTRLGRYIYAIGSSEPTARLCGVPVVRVKLIVYTLATALVGLAGVVMLSRLSVGDPTTAVGAELTVIAAVVIGGGSLAGGEGSILGTLVGALLMTVIATGCVHLGVENWVQEIITGGIIVLAVAVDRLRQLGRT